ncbi:MAG: UPF0175 family protein [Anaerolineae bacterium]|nr:UPF0175 family protein [Anaerolineae bacterium]
METVSVTLQQPIRQFVEQQSRERKIPAQTMVVELIQLGFEALLKEHYQHYRQGKISFGRLAQILGITTWELSHLLEERGWPAYNLPTGT